VIPVEFMIGANGHETRLAHQHQLLIANCLAQSEALMRGRTTEEARAQLIAGRFGSEADRLAPHKTFPGNRPSITLVYDRLTPFRAGTADRALRTPGVRRSADLRDQRL
jgi:glucose-6-phosphate isomerase